MYWPFKKYDVEMSPEVHGVITLERVPQEAMTVVRELFYEGYNKGKAILDETQTNEQGEFSFPAMSIRSRLPGDIFGGSLKVYQHISVECQSEKKEIWGVWAPTEGAKSLRWMLTHINCELSNSKRVHEVDISPVEERLVPVHSICDWNSPSINTYVYDQSTDTYVRYKKTPQPLESIFNAKHRVKLDAE
ncbi:hypothetical protein KZY42_002220 [Vibrio vulnificus]|uniref:DUF6795 domain-containing protein n=1 Tax=Vibrio vulnificus TaxID=672 RepID=UPI001029839B|nr:DUF6795 domain-containing protein [Vibrio vulnificus]EGR0208941.1 hypothetical protein [Vibrio vulnificus]EHU9444801.1 hypothetical protein [Vibrio vulnificus]MCU8498450.1 hypothetical protein [Vibrio vulnificus]RZQ04698.1 hypothetical protein D8T65_03085 [Vibrio vulnificus]HAS8562223.1 hypothetical protein [Vibrio vulnificus]